MEKCVFHLIENSEYFGIITILDYEVVVSIYLSKLTLPSVYKGKKALVDLALKSGVNEYRFISFDIDNQGKLVLDTNTYTCVSKEVEKTADYFLKQRRDIVNNSVLTDSQKRKILS